MKLLWQQIGDPTITEILCSTKLDGVVFDLEHGSFNDQVLYNCIRVATLSKKKCFIRVESFDKKSIKMSLDAGCDGVILSTVEDVNETCGIIDYMKYPEDEYSTRYKRGRGLVRENFWGEKEFSNRKPIVIAQIETKKGVSQMEKLKVLDIDYFLVGPYDLSASLGCLGNFECERYKNAISNLEFYIDRGRMGYHLVKDVEIQYDEFKDCGLLAFGIDTLMLLSGIKGLNIYADAQ